MWIVAFMSNGLPLNNTSLLKELRHDILSRFLRLAKQPLPPGKPQDISLVRQKNTKDEITMDGED